MLNIIWLSLILGSVVLGIVNGTLDHVVVAVTESTKAAIEIAIGITGLMIFWLGLMRIAEKAGIISLFARLLRPILRYLFPSIPADHPAMGAMVMNMAANMLGLNNAATPFGLRAMESLQALNTDKKTATDAMCMFLAINTSSIQLIPATTIAFLAAAGSKQPTAIVFTGFLATLCSTIVAISLAKIFAGRSKFHQDNEASDLDTETAVERKQIQS